MFFLDMETKTIKSKKITEEKEDKLQPEEGPRSILSFKEAILIAVVVILVAGFYALNRAGYIKDLPLAEQVQKEEQISVEDSKILAKLKTIIILPDDVIPTMALVTNADVLKQQQPVFFANVKNGDRLVIYPDLAIIYDYKANKIIKVGPVQTAGPAQNLPVQNAPAQQ